MVSPDEDFDAWLAEGGMTVEEAERAYDEAPEIPISEEEIKRIVDFATGRNRNGATDGEGEEAARLEGVRRTNEEAGRRPERGSRTEDRERSETEGSKEEREAVNHGILVIELHPIWVNCAACGEPTPSNWGLPVSQEDGSVLPIDSDEEWGGVPACKCCHDKHANGEAIRLK